MGTDSVCAFGLCALFGFLCSRNCVLYSLDRKYRKEENILVGRVTQVDLENKATPYFSGKFS